MALTPRCACPLPAPRFATGGLAMTILADARTLLTSASPSRALKYLPITALALDLAVMVAVGVLAAIGRARLPIFGGSADVTGWLDVAGPLMLVGWLLTVAAFGGYRVNVFGAGTDEYKRVAHASLVASGLVGAGCYLARFPLSRGFFLLAFALGLPALLAGRYLLRRALHRARLNGVLLQRVLIAGSPAHVDEIAVVLRRERWLGYTVIGALTPALDTAEETPSGIPVLGNADEAPSLVGACGADVILFAGGALGSANQLRKVIWDLEQHDVHVIVAPSVTDVSSERVRVRPVGGLPLMHVDPPTSIDASRWAKRLFDIMGSSTLLIAFAPLLILAALRIAGTTVDRCCSARRGWDATASSSLASSCARWCPTPRHCCLS